MFISVPQEDRVIKICPNNCLPKCEDNPNLELKLILNEQIRGKTGDFCSTCGSKLLEKHIKQNDDFKCDNCGNMLLLIDSTQYCPYCGVPKDKSITKSSV